MWKKKGLDWRRGMQRSMMHMISERVRNGTPRPRKDDCGNRQRARGRVKRIPNPHQTPMEEHLQTSIEIGVFKSLLHSSTKGENRNEQRLQMMKQRLDIPSRRPSE